MPGPRPVGTLAVGIVCGVIALGAIRLTFLPPLESTHFHANWALWIDGDRVDLSADRYMEDVAACSADAANITAPQRVHLHENNPDVLHVHHQGATWGHLLQNLGWGIGPNWLITDDGYLLAEADGRRLTFVLNELVVPPASNRVIQAGDRLLISYGKEELDELVRDQFPSVADNAPEFDQGFDPAGCQGTQAETLAGRLRRSFWF